MAISTSRRHRVDVNRFRDGHVEKSWFPGVWVQSIVEDAEGIVFTNRNKLSRLVNDEMCPTGCPTARNPSSAGSTSC